MKFKITVIVALGKIFFVISGLFWTKKGIQGDKDLGPDLDPGCYGNIVGKTFYAETVLPYELKS